MSSKVMNAILVCLLSAGAAVVSAGDGANAGATLVNANEIKWGAAPTTLPAGAKLAVLNGDPGKPGPFVMRLMMPAGYVIAPHGHTLAEQLTVISGTFYIGMGDKTDRAQAHALTAGGFHYLPGTAHLFAFVKQATVVQVEGIGPFDINYLDPRDDPQSHK
jgi:hypothetical protein